MKDKIISLAVLLVMVFSFFIPEWLLAIEDLKVEKQVCRITKPESKIDVQAEKIYLVKAIHAMNGVYRNIKISEKDKVYYTDNPYVEVSSSKDGTELISMSSEKMRETLKNEVSKLENANIVKEISADIENRQFLIDMSQSSYKNEENEYLMKCFNMVNETKKVKFEIENKTGKILYLSFPKDKLSEYEVQEILENYMKYLDLYIINDWKFENRVLKSEKAQLIIVLIENQTEYCLTIHPIEDGIQSVNG